MGLSVKKEKPGQPGPDGQTNRGEGGRVFKGSPPEADVWRLLGKIT